MVRYKHIMINGKMMQRSRYVMEQHLGRKLTSDEVVHHINGDKIDDRIENLQVMTRSEHMRLHNKGENNHMYGKIGSKNPRYNIPHTEETKHLMSERKMGSGNPRWIEGDVSSRVRANRRYRARKRIWNGKGTLEDFLYLKRTGGIYKITIQARYDLL